MIRILFATTLLVAFSAAPALAQLTKIEDWTIEKRTQDQHCNANRGYRDSEDGNHDYAIVLSYSNAVIVIVLIYDGWEWDNVGDMLRADIATDNDGIMRKAKWEVINNTTVRGVFQFDQTIMDKLTRAKRLNVDFEDDDDDSIEFQLPRASEVLAALKFCEQNRK